MSETQSATSPTDDGSWLSAIVEGSDDAVFMVGRDGTIRSWNRGASEIFGYAIEEIVGRPVETLADGVGRAEITELFGRVM